MTEEIAQTELSMWFSTYGLLTAKRVLERFNIRIENDELVAAMKNPQSIYHQLLSVPLKNIFNGIILQQAQDYQLYVQKLFIDYLLSGEGGKSDESPGGTTREDLENERTKLLDAGESFERIESAHRHLIAESQARLINISTELQHSLQMASTIIGQRLRAKGVVKDDKLTQQAIRRALIHYNNDEEEILAVSSLFWGKMAEVLEIELNNELRQEISGALREVIDLKKTIENTLRPYVEQTEDIGIQLRSYRRQFYDLILRATECIKYLPDYRVDNARDQDNRSSLYFDSFIGGE